LSFSLLKFLAVSSAWGSVGSAFQVFERAVQVWFARASVLNGSHRSPDKPKPFGFPLGYGT